MDAQDLNENISALVDVLRSEDDAPTTLAEVASVTEVLITTMRRFFDSLDASLYKEFRSLSEYIHNAKEEISLLQPGDLTATRLPSAGKQLDAVVMATEEATQTIMDIAEEIMAADKSDIEAYGTMVDEAGMRLIEACSFQDITGQRIAKVVDTITYIEERLDKIQATWGVIASTEMAGTDEMDKLDGTVRLSGPQLDGDGIDQAQVDAFFD